ncbi:hypothetical protein BOTBODRAFT_54509 [Botryobasidium botryosum FD-172 SS1]|uniref:SWR1-complex protein 5 n=1 Tax=Botryobasidium botryosum (strain FD-172 SS1) TaxID=930990 RepID=A0A067MJ79_BOTB1|nr:hypothetical protein BOTBODRAFT_54509 [Botryobasidium botryosum FD-172 SS1]
MATLDTLATHGSDSEDDSDFVPDDASADSRSDSSGDDDCGKRRATKKIKLPDAALADTDGDANADGCNKQAEAEAEADQAHARASLWAQFEASVASSSTSQQGTGTRPSPVKTVLIEKKFRFAGEDVIEVKEVPEDSEEAKQWPRAAAQSLGEDEGRNPEHAQPPTSTNGGAQITDHVANTSASAAMIAASASAAAPTSAEGSTELPKMPPPPRGAGRRRPKATLSALAAASASSTPKKLTMLEKSKMDWNAHLASSSGIQDELQTNRKSGAGYLEKVDFLDRVGARREELEKEKGKRKR